jgi:hypothetical protein
MNEKVVWVFACSVVALLEAHAGGEPGVVVLGLHPLEAHGVVWHHVRGLVSDLPIVVSEVAKTVSVVLLVNLVAVHHLMFLKVSSHVACGLQGLAWLVVAEVRFLEELDAVGGDRVARLGNRQAAKFALLLRNSSEASIADLKVGTRDKGSGQGVKSCVLNPGSTRNVLELGAGARGRVKCVLTCDLHGGRSDFSLVL